MFGNLGQGTEFWVIVGSIVYSVRKEGREEEGREGKEEEGREEGKKMKLLVLVLLMSKFQLMLWPWLWFPTSQKPCFFQTDATVFPNSALSPPLLGFLLTLSRSSSQVAAFSGNDGENISNT